MHRSTAIFASSDIEATLAYYKDVLGFESSWTWGEPPTFGSARRGGVTIMFNLQPGLAAQIKGHEHWIQVDDTDEIYESHKASGAKIVDEIGDKPWGFREYVVEDCNGYHLRIAGPLVGKVVASKPFPDGVTIERRAPTESEFSEVAGTVFEYKKLTEGLLESTWGGVVALSPEGKAVGVLRIMQDAPGWFSIWDVAVLTEWQAHRIGSTMMREALAVVKEASPSAIVFLFTMKHEFYEKLGFGKETASTYRL